MNRSNLAKLDEYSGPHIAIHLDEVDSPTGSGFDNTRSDPFWDVYDAIEPIIEEVVGSKGEGCILNRKSPYVGFEVRLGIEFADSLKDLRKRIEETIQGIQGVNKFRLQ